MEKMANLADGECGEAFIRYFPSEDFDESIRFVDPADLDFVKCVGDQPDFSDEEIAILEEVIEQQVKEKQSRIIQNTAPRTLILTGMEMPEEGHNQDLGLTLNDDEWEAMDEAVEERAKQVSAEKRAAAAKAKKANETDLFSGPEKAGG